MDRTLEEPATTAQTSAKALIQQTHSLDFDLVQCSWIVDKVRQDRVYAQNLYAALCNTEWQEQDAWEVLRDRTWSCNWRTAGIIVADIRQSGDYTDWYCSGSMISHPDDDLGTASYKTLRGFRSEGDVADHIRQDLLALGWKQVYV